MFELLSLGLNDLVQTQLSFRKITFLQCRVQENFASSSDDSWQIYNFFIPTSAKKIKEDQ